MNGMYYLRQPIKINTIMTKIQETLVALPEEKKALFIPAFGDVDKFYTTVYLIAPKRACDGAGKTGPLRRPLAGDPPDSWQGGEVGEFFRVGRL